MIVGMGTREKEKVENTLSNLYFHSNVIAIYTLTVYKYAYMRTKTKVVV